MSHIRSHAWRPPLGRRKAGAAPARRSSLRRRPEYCRPRAELLEDRTLPASLLDFQGTALIWNGFTVGSANQVTLATSGANYVFSDPAEAINFGPGVPASWSGGGGNMVMGPISSVTSITIDGGSDTMASDTLAVNSAITTPGDVSLTGFDVINVNAALGTTAGSLGMVTLAANAQPASTLTINATGAVSADGPASLTGNGALTVGGPVTTNNQDITLNGDTMTLGAVVSAGTNVVTLLPVTPTLGIDLGADSGSGNLVLTNTDLNNVTAGVLRIGDVTEQGNTGDIQLTADVTLSSGVSTLALSTGGAIIDIGTFTLAVPGLALLAANGIGDASPFLTAVSNLAFSNTAANGVQICNTGGLTVTSVDTVLTSANQGTTTTLSATSPVTFAVNTTSASTLMVTAQETATPSFDNVTVDPGVTVQVTAGDVVFQAGDDIVISAGATVQASGNVTLTAAFQDVDNEGMIQIDGTVIASATTGVVTLDVGAVGLALEGAAGSIQADALLLLGTAAAGSFTLDSAINQVSLLAANTAAAIIFQDNAALTVDSVAGTNGIHTSGNDVTLCTQIGDLVLNQPINAAGATVRLASAGGVSQAAAGAITAANLGVLAAGAVALDGATNMVANVFAANDTGAGSAVAFLDGVGFTVDMVTAASCFMSAAVGVTTSGADITLCNQGGNLVLNQPVNAGAGTVRLSSAGGVSQNATGVITGANLGVLASGVVALDGATNMVGGVFAANDTGASGTIVFLDGLGFTVGMVTAARCFTQAAAGVTTAGQDITLCNQAEDLALNQPVNAGAGTVRLSSAGNVSQNATGVITGANLGVRAGAAVALDGANNVVAGMFAASAGGALRFFDTVGFQVGSVGSNSCFTAVTGIGGGDLTLCTQGSLLIAAPITGGIIRLSAGGSVTQTAAGPISGTALGVLSGGLIDLCVANNVVTGAFAARDSGAAVSPILFPDGVGFTVATVTADPVNPACFGGATGVVTVAGGDITLRSVAGSLALSQVVTSGTGTAHGTVRLSAGTSVTQAAAGVITAANLSVIAGGMIDLAAGVNTVTGMFAAHDMGVAVSPILFQDSVGFTAGAVTADPVHPMCFAGTTGVVTDAGGDITLCNLAGNLAINQVVTSGTGATHGTVRLSSAATVIQTAAGAITAANLGVIAGGMIDLAVATTNAVTGLFAAHVTGALSPMRFQDSVGFTVGTVTADPIHPLCFAGFSGVVTDAGGDTTLCNLAGNLAINQPITSGTGGTHGTVRLSSAGTVIQTAAGVITGANLGVIAGGTINLAVAANVIVNNTGVMALFAAQDSGVANTNPLSFFDTASFTVATVTVDPVHPMCFAGVTGVTTVNSNALTLTTSVALTVNQPVTSGTGATHGTILFQVGTMAVFNYDQMNLPSFNATITGNTATVQDTAGTPGTLVMNYTVGTNWDVTGANSGTVSNSQIRLPNMNGLMGLQNFGNLLAGPSVGNLMDGPGPDYFMFENAGYVTGNVDGRGGTNTLDFTHKTTAVTVHVTSPATPPFLGFNGNTPAPPTPPPIGGTFANISQVFNNDNAGSTLIGPDITTSWAIDAQDHGTLSAGGQTLLFSGFPNLTGGSATDYFTFVTRTSPPPPSTGFLTGKLDGGGGTNTLSYSDPNTAQSGYAAVSVLLTGFGSPVASAGFDGTDFITNTNTRIIATGFFNITNLNGGFGTSGNSLAGRTDTTSLNIWNVFAVRDPQFSLGNNVGGNYTVNGNQTLFFSRFQSLTGGPGSPDGTLANPRGNVFNVLSTPAGLTTTISGNVNNDLFIVGNAAGLDDLQGPVVFHGGGFNPPDQTAPPQGATVSCPPRPPVSVSLPEGDILLVSDAPNATNGSSYNLAPTSFSRSRPGDPSPQGTVNFDTLQSLNFTIGSGSDAFTVTNTAPSTADTITTPLNATGHDTITIVNTGTGSLTNFNGSNGGTETDDIHIDQTGGVDPVTHQQAVVHLTKAMGTLNVFQDNTPPGSPAVELIEVGAVALSLQLPPQNANLLSQIYGTPQTTLQLGFPLSDYRFQASMGMNQIVLASNTSFPVVCFPSNVNVPQNNFVVSSYLIPSGNPLIKPTISLVVSGGFIIQSQLFNTPFAPIVAQPTFNSEFGYSPATVTVADVNGDGVPDLIVAMGSGFEPVVTVFDGNSIFRAGMASSPTVSVLAQFFAFDSTFVGGEYVAAANLHTTVPTGPSTFFKPDIIVGAGRGGSPLVSVFEYDGSYNPSVFPGGGVHGRNSFLAYNGAFAGGVRVAAGDVFGDVRDDIITAPGPGVLGFGEAQVRVWSAVAPLAPPALLDQLNAYPNFYGGVYIAAGSYFSRATSAGTPIADILTGPGSGGSPIIDVFQLLTPGVPPAGASVSFLAFMDSGSPGIVNGTDPRTAGVSSVAFSVDPMSGRLDIVVGSGEGRPSETQIFNAALVPVDAFFTIFMTVDNVYDPRSVVLGGVAVGGFAP